MKNYTPIILCILLPLGMCYADATEWGKLDSLNGLFYKDGAIFTGCLLYTSPSPRDKRQSLIPS